jgi:ParB family chromosome partitioning protein
VNRRSVLKSTAALAAASLGTNVWTNTSADARNRKTGAVAIDKVLNDAVQGKQVPGVVGMAANESGVIYEGAFGKRNIDTGSAMTLDTVFHRREFRAIAPVTPALTEEEVAEYDSLAQERDEYDGVLEEDLSEEDRMRIAEIEAKLAGYDAQAAVYSDEQKAKAGAFLSIDHGGTLLVERGYRRLTDLAAEQRHASAGRHSPADKVDGDCERESDDTGVPYDTGEPGAAAADDDSAELPDRLLTELAAYHSLGLRNALADNHCTAYLAVLHALTLKLFYRYSTESCLQIEARDTLVPPFPGLGEFKAAQAIAARHEAFQKLLPGEESVLWDFLRTLNEDRQRELFGHCAGLTVNALHEAFARSNKRRHGHQLTETVNLDMGAQGFITTAANYLGRITKQQILDTVAEAKGQDTADLLAGLKKKEMAAEAERLLAGAGWLPEPLRTAAPLEPEESEADPLPAFLEDAAPMQQAAE